MGSEMCIRDRHLNEKFTINLLKVIKSLPKDIYKLYNSFIEWKEGKEKVISI